MKQIILLACIFFLSACGSGTKQLSEFDSLTSHHQRIAVLPIQSTFKLTEKQKEKVSATELEEMELKQALNVQDAVESYLVGEDLRVRVQSSSVTNAKLKEHNIDLQRIADYSVLDLANKLGVDAVVSGYFESEQPMSDLLATGLDIAKQLERQVVGSFFGNNINTATNRGNCSLGLFENQHGDRLWSYQDEFELGKGSNTRDIVQKLMEEGAKRFPYRR